MATTAAPLIPKILSSTGLISLGLYHLISTTHNHLKSPRDYTAKPCHPFNFFSSSSSSQHIKHLQLYLLLIFLTLSFFHQILISATSDPLLKGSTPVHLFTSLQSAAVLFLFLLLTISLILSEVTSFFPIPSDLFFAVASAVFFLQSSVSSSSASVQISNLEAKCDSIYSFISALSSILCILLACRRKLFVADVGLGGSVCLQGLWVLQTGLSLYVDGFIPEGCHRLLDVVSGVEGSTKCDLEEWRLRAVAILDLLFVLHVMFVVVIVMVSYALVAKTVGMRRLGSYDALPTLADSNHLQMKALTGTQE